MRTTILSTLFNVVFLITITVAAETDSTSTAGLKIVDIGNRRELFIDTLVIDHLEDAELRLHQPCPREIALHVDRPWEGAFNFGMSVVQFDERFRIYYRATTFEHGSFMCVAESTDAVVWTKPDLSLVEIAGTKHNNVIATVSGELTTDPKREPLIEVFYDERPDVPFSERFKAITLNEERLPKKVIGWVSTDGLRWRKVQDQPIMEPSVFNAFDGMDSLFWSEAEQCYIVYFRYAWQGNGSEIRSVARATSKDFRHWTKPEPMRFDDGEEKPPFQVYTNQTLSYFRAPHLYVAFPARFMKDRRVLSDEQVAQMEFLLWEGYEYFNDCSDTVLISSRAGSNLYQYRFREGFVRPGFGLGNWGSRSNYTLYGLVVTGQNELSLFVTRQYALPSWHIQRFSLRMDGFVSVHAGFQAGEMITKPLRFRGSHLEINFSTSAAGSVWIELQDQQGRAIPGYSMEQCKELIGDDINTVASWKNGSDVSSLQGRPIHLRCRLKDADLFSFRFGP